MEYVLTGVEQSENIRSYGFAEIDRTLRRAGFTVAVDISLLRKYAIPLLEYLDRERVTRRAGDERVIL